MAYKSKARKIRDALVTILQGINYDAGTGNEPAFGIVTADPSLESDEEPYALVYPGLINNNLVATGEMDRSVGFAVFVVLKMETDSRNQLQTYDYMTDLTELILDTIDEGDFTDVLNTVDSSLGTWMMEATRGTFKPAKSNSGAILLCQIDVAIHYSKDL